MSLSAMIGDVNEQCHKAAPPTLPVLLSFCNLRALLKKSSFDFVVVWPMEKCSTSVATSVGTASPLHSPTAKHTSLTQVFNGQSKCLQ